MGWFSIFVISVLKNQNFYIGWSLIHQFLFFSSSSFCVLSNKSLPNSRQLKISPIFSLKILIVLTFTLGLQGDPTSPFWRRSALGLLWKEWCWSWNSSALATSCEELTHWKRLWCWEGLRAGGEGDDRGWDGWMTSLTLWVWVNSGSWWWTGRPGVLRFMGSQRVGHDWATELNWTELLHLGLRSILS